MTWILWLPVAGYAFFNKALVLTWKMQITLASLASLQTGLNEMFVKELGNSRVVFVSLLLFGLVFASPCVL